MTMTLPKRPSRVSVDEEMGASNRAALDYMVNDLKDRFGDAWSRLRFQRSIGGNPTWPTTEPGDLTDPPGAAAPADPAPDDARPDATKRETVDEPPWWTVHLPIEACDIETALTLADTVAKLAAEHPMVLNQAATVSRWDDQRGQVSVYCDQRLPEGQRCGLRNHHRGICEPQERPTN